MSDAKKVKYVLEVKGQPAGAGVEIPGLGVFENGTHEITDQQAEDYRDRNAVATVETDEDGVITSTVDRGMTLLEASEGMVENVSVSTYEKASPKGGDK